MNGPCIKLSSLNSKSSLLNSALRSWASLQSRFSFAIRQRVLEGDWGCAEGTCSFLHTCRSLRVSPADGLSTCQSQLVPVFSSFCTFPESAEAQFCGPLSSCDDSTSGAVTPSLAVCISVPYDSSFKLLDSNSSNLCPLLFRPLG